MQIRLKREAASAMVSGRPQKVIHKEKVHMRKYVLMDINLLILEITREMVSGKVFTTDVWLQERRKNVKHLFFIGVVYLFLTGGIERS